MRPQAKGSPLRLSQDPLRFRGAGTTGSEAVPTLILGASTHWPNLKCELGRFPFFPCPCLPIVALPLGPCAIGNKKLWLTRQAAEALGLT